MYSVSRSPLFYDRRQVVAPNFAFMLSAQAHTARGLRCRSSFHKNTFVFLWKPFYCIGITSLKSFCFHYKGVGEQVLTHLLRKFLPTYIGQLPPKIRGSERKKFRENFPRRARKKGIKKPVTALTNHRLRPYLARSLLYGGQPFYTVKEDGKGFVRQKSVH